MNLCDGRLYTIESQSSTDAPHDQRSQRYFSMNTINNGLRTLSSLGLLQAGGEATMTHVEDPESVQEFFTDLRLSDLFDLPGEYVLMNAEMFSALSDGNKSWLEKLRSDGTPMACLKSRHQGDSVLHLVAAWGHLKGVKSIISECPCLLLDPNWKDQLPLHVAARAGHLAVVEALVATITFFLAKLSEVEREYLNPYLMKDTNGDTALNLALKGRHMKTASSLVNANQQALFLADKDGRSPLYLAVEIGDVSLVREMFGNDDHEGLHSNLESQLEWRKYLAHIALKSMSTDILDVILNKYPSLVDERDEEGRTCLSIAASIGFYEGICNLLNRSTSNIFECNDDGTYPIHMAVEKGHIKVVKEILKRCPHSKHLLNQKDQNIFHIAANSGKFKLLRQLKAYAHLADEQDVDGNTPLHLATIKWRPQAVSWLTRKENLLIQNNSGLTALDIAELNLQPHYIFRERLTLMTLVSRHVQLDGRLMNTMKLTRPSVPMDHHGNKEYINALLVVATLVATVTFAAGFTLPGGYNSSAPNVGRAALATDCGFVLFMIFNTVAMNFSSAAVVFLIWAQLGNPAAVRSSLNMALPLLYIALLSMAYAFSTAMTIAVRNFLGLTYFTIFTSSIFLCALFFVPVLHIVLQLPSLHARWSFVLFYLSSVIADEDSSYQTSTNLSVKVVESVDHIKMPDTR